MQITGKNQTHTKKKGRKGQLSNDTLNKNISFNSQQNGTLGREKILFRKKLSSEGTHESIRSDHSCSNRHLEQKTAK